MSNAEHLIENALCLIEKNRTFEDFKSYEYNQTMAHAIGVDLWHVWNMAQYVLYTYIPTMESIEVEKPCTIAGDVLTTNA